jgi:hypothetical protein
MHANNINTSHLRLPRLRTVRPNSGRSFTLSIQLEFVFVRDL